MIIQRKFESRLGAAMAGIGAAAGGLRAANNPAKCKAQRGGRSGENGCKGKNSCMGKGGCSAPLKAKRALRT